MEALHPGLARGARAYGRGVAWSAIVAGGAVLLGWFFGSDWLKGAIGTPITVKANTAVCFVLTGAALLLSFQPKRARAGGLASLAVAMIGVLTLVEHLSGWNFGIDQIFFQERHGATATASPGRMGPPASLSFVALGLGLCLLDWRLPGGRYPFRYLPLLASAVALVSIVGYLSGIPELYAVSHLTGIAWPTAVLLFLLGPAALTIRAENPLMRLFCGAGTGGEAARRLLLPAIGIPIALLLARNWGLQAGWFDQLLGNGLMTLGMVVALLSAVVFTAQRLSAGSERAARSESELRRREEDLRDFFDNASIGLQFVGADGRIIRANRAMLDLLGYDADEYVGRRMAEFHIDRGEGESVIDRLRSGEAIREHPAKLRAKDGSTREVLIDLSVCWDGGRFAHARCFIRDITEQRRGEQAGLQLAAIVESSVDAIISKDLDGIIRSWNRAAEKMFGYSAAEMIGRSITVLIPVERIGEEFSILERLRRGDRIQSYETERIRKDGTRITVSLSISPMLDPRGRGVIGAAKIARDITDRRQIEAEREALLESERAARMEAERATRLRDEFLAVVSHELRTPLNSILGWAQLLRRSAADPATVREGIEAIERGARGQAQLIEDLFDMNRIISGKLSLSVSNVNLAAVVESAITTVRPTIEMKGVRLHSVLDTSLGPVAGDPARLQQIAWNLLSNAVKFTPKDGEIRVLLRRAGSHAEVSVADTGIGIAPTFLPHVFERFRQADSSTTRAYGGLGLGLAIVKNLVEMHGGTVSVQSDGEARGATFTVRLPLAALQAANAHASDQAGRLQETDAVDLGNIRVLLVEDDGDTRELLKRILARCNAEVLTAANGSEAIQIIQTDTPDVLISDIGMPQMDGFQLIRRVRALDSERARMIPAVALTAYARSDDRTRAMLAGFQVHVSKPIEPQELVVTIASLAGRIARTE